MAGHRGQMQQERESCFAFHQSADRRALQAEDQIAFPVTRHSAVFCFGGAFADHDLIGNKRFAFALSPRCFDRTFLMVA